jgi:hypothetical protein
LSTAVGVTVGVAPPARPVAVARIVERGVEGAE